ncbi:MAG TPA: TetR family transcriptional regulator [Mycobacteriales bacterium]|jgi:AcrR family transcriptional regulator|nr:TetR family transcriptional regulator [Mycobacteriales bacterium]
MAVAEEPRRLRADAARNRQALIDAAQRLFAARGLTVTLDDIAEAAGVNVATAYRHFANKHELAAAYIEQQIDTAITIADESADLADPWQGLTEFFRRTLDLMIANRGLHEILTPGLGSEWFIRLEDRVRPVLSALITRGQKAGAVRCDLQQADVGVIVQMLAAVSDIPAPDPSALVGRYLTLLLDGLRPGGTQLPGSPPSQEELRAAHTALPKRPARQP